MSDMVAIVEGKTEKSFVDGHLRAYLWGLGIDFWATLAGHREQRGGVRAWESVRGEIIRTLKHRRGRVCTIMFDFYGMPDDWPGRTQAADMTVNEKGDHVEKALLDDLAVTAGKDFRRELFIPYVQVHEFEALLFADVNKMAESLAPDCQTEQDRLRTEFQDILDKAGQAEAINDNYETCPSRRITSIVPTYRKSLYGPIVAGRIGLDVLRKKCPHFGQWLGRLEALGADGANG